MDWHHNLSVHELGDGDNESWEAFCNGFQGTPYSDGPSGNGGNNLGVDGYGSGGGGFDITPPIANQYASLDAILADEATMVTTDNAATPDVTNGGDPVTPTTPPTDDQQMNLNSPPPSDDNWRCGLPVIDQVGLANVLKYDDEGYGTTMGGNILLGFCNVPYYNNLQVVQFVTSTADKEAFFDGDGYFYNDGVSSPCTQWDFMFEDASRRPMDYYGDNADRNAGTWTAYTFLVGQDPGNGEWVNIESYIWGFSYAHGVSNMNAFQLAPNYCITAGGSGPIPNWTFNYNGVVYNSGYYGSNVTVTGN